MALKLKGSTSGFVAIDAPSVAGNNTLILPENTGSAHQILANDITAGVTTFTQVTVSRNGDLTVPGTISIGGTLTYEDVTSVDSVGIVTARGLSIFGNTTGLQVASGISTFQGITATTATLTGNADVEGALIVGNGVASPLSGFSAHFHSTGTSNRIQITTSNTGVTNSDGAIIMVDSSSNMEILNRENTNIEFFTNNTQRLFIDNAGRLILGTNTARTFGGGVYAHLQLEGTTQQGSQFTVTRNTNDTYAPNISLVKTRGTSNGAVTTVQDNDSLGTIQFRGADGSDVFAVAASITGEVDGSPSDGTDMPGALTFGTTADGAASPTERMRIASNGYIGINNNSAGTRLHVVQDWVNSYGSISAEGSANALVGYGFRSNGNYRASVIWRDGSSGNYMDLATYGGSYPLLLRTNGTEGARISGNQNLLVGTTTDTQRLHVYNGNGGTGYKTALFDSNDTSNGTRVVITNSGNTSNRGLGIIVGGQAGTNNASLGWFNNDNTYVAPNILTITSDSKVLMGGTSAYGNFENSSTNPRLQIRGTDLNGSCQAWIRATADAGAPKLFLANTRNTSGNSHTVVQNGDELGGLFFAGSDGSQFVNGASITSYVGGSPGADDVPAYLSFGTNSGGASTTERMRINANGQIRIGDPSGNAQTNFDVVRTANSTLTDAMLIKGNVGNGFIRFQDNDNSCNWTMGVDDGAGMGDNAFIFYNRVDLAYRFLIAGNGKVRSPATYSGTTTGGGPVYVESDGDFLRYTSSIKYKTDIQTIENDIADKILNCRPVKYKSKCENDIKTKGSDKSDWTWYGFIAEEVAEIEPRLVNWATKDFDNNVNKSVERDPSNYEAEGVRYDNFVPLLVNLAKRQKEEIELLKARLDAAGL